MMDDEDDDFYDPADAVPVTHHQNGSQHPPTDSKAQDANDGDEEEIEVEEDEDDFNIITEAPPDAPPAEAPHPRHASLRADTQHPSSAESSAISKSITPTATPKAEAATPVPASARPAVPQKPGSAYPPVHASNIDVHANPVHPSTGKPIMLTDMDSDFPEDDKPWRRPGSDITDYFNYGFDEFTWASYVLKQQELRKEIGDQKKQLDDMQSFLSMGLPPMPGGPPTGAGPGAPPGNAPPPMPGMPGMPDMSADMMQGMLASMMSQGLDPSSMDPMSFMQHAQAMMGGQSGAGGGQQGQPGFGGQGGGQAQMGYGGGYGGGGGGRGRGRRWSFLRNVKNLAPLLDRVLVQRVKPEAKTASGIFLPESSVKEQNEAKVLAVGPGAVDKNGQRLPMSVAPGDRVLIPQFGGSAVKVGEEEYTLFRDYELLAKIRE
ncbi:Cpn10-domain-containing protein [Aspergillus ellipticus CBS 707.79]|uniref:Cpn10-domain-containing protein n=1 Tax=Aspergillus ellipticus CBS 707.79 TaxID=1448320 RepID=A0A319DGQ9_9EURO|nr:Cpn10-domain-containing protein [Aspergillus ellipticus CBS 707.79]